MSPCRSTTLLTVLMLLMHSCRDCESFSMPTIKFPVRRSPFLITSGSKTGNISIVSSLAAKKRRRRKEPIGNVTEDIVSDATLRIDDENGSGGELPDFDLGGKEQIPDLMVSASSDDEYDAAEIPAMGELQSLSDPLVVEAMKGSPSSPSPGTAKDLLRSRDRNLEATFEFDEVATKLPTAAEAIKKDSAAVTLPRPGKKKARAEARRTAAIEAQENKSSSIFTAMDDQTPSIISKIPFLNKNKKEYDETEDKLKPIKLVEQGTWFCIYTLIAWEIYINTPLFNRVAPMAPVVY